MKSLILLLPAVALAASCTAPVPAAAPEPDRPMDEVPVQSVLPNGERLYSFRNGCDVVLQARQAVLVREDPECALHHRDIALLYASGD